MALSDEQGIFTQQIGVLIAKAVELGFHLSFGEVWRTPVQAWLNSRPPGTNLRVVHPDGTMEEYPEKVGGVGIAKSKHLDRLAVDFIFRKDGNLIDDKDLLSPLGTFWESLDPKNRWGGNFQSHPDLPHFERNV